jgi:hypothetical protein
MKLTLCVVAIRRMACAAKKLVFVVVSFQDASAQDMAKHMKANVVSERMNGYNETSNHLSQTELLFREAATAVHSNGCSCDPKLETPIVFPRSTDPLQTSQAVASCGLGQKLREAHFAAGRLVHEPLCRRLCAGS